MINTFNISLQACNNTLKSYLILALLLINPSMNPTASILKYMSEMDIEMLSLILDDNLIIPERNNLVPDTQICNWVPLRYMAQDSTTPSGLRLSQAHELFHQDEYENALDLYKELLETRNDYQEAWIGLAVTQYMLGNYDEALTASHRLHEWRYRAFLNIFLKQCELKSKEI